MNHVKEILEDLYWTNPDGFELIRQDSEGVEAIVLAVLDKIRTEPVVVLDVHGKKEDVDRIIVRIFSSAEDAERHCKSVRTPFGEKYWWRSDIIEPGTEQYLYL